MSSPPQSSFSILRVIVLVPCVIALLFTLAVGELLLAALAAFVILLVCLAKA